MRNSPKGQSTYGLQTKCEESFDKFIVDNIVRVVYTEAKEV